MGLDAARWDAAVDGPTAASPTVDLDGTDLEKADRAAAAGAASVGAAPVGGLAGSQDHVGRACARLAAGGPVVITSDDSSGPHWLALDAGSVTPQAVAFAARHSSGLFAVVLRPDRIATLGLRPRQGGRLPAPRGALVTTVGARVALERGDATGLARTVRLLGNQSTGPRDLTVPGPVRVLRADALGVVTVPRGPEAAADLAEMAGAPAAAVVELLDDIGELADRHTALEFARTHELPVVSIGALVDACLTGRPLVRREVTTDLPTRHGAFRAVGFVGELDGAEHIALTKGLDDERPAHRAHAVVHIQRWCVGAAVGASSCGCAENLDRALRRLGCAPAGIVVCVRADAGVGSGLGHGLGTGDTSAPGDHGLGRLDGAAAAQIVTSFGIRSATLTVADRRQVTALRQEGVLVRGAMREPVRHPAGTTGSPGRARPAPPIVEKVLAGT